MWSKCISFETIAIEIYGVCVNISKSTFIVVSRSRTVNLPHRDLIIEGYSFDTVDSFKLVEVFFDKKSWLLKNIYVPLHLELLKRWEFYESVWVFMINSQKYRIIFFDFSYLYLSTVWRSAVDTHLKLFDRSIDIVKFILPDFKVDLGHRRHVGSLSLFFKIINNVHYPFYKFLN